MAKRVGKNGGRTEKRDPTAFIGVPPGVFAGGNMQCAAISGDLRLFCYRHKNWMRQSLVTPKNNQGLWSLLDCSPRCRRTSICNNVEADRGALAWWSDQTWALPDKRGVKTNFSYVINVVGDVDARGLSNFAAFGFPKRVGQGGSIVYLVAFRDAHSEPIVANTPTNCMFPPTSRPGSIGR